MTPARESIEDVLESFTQCGGAHPLALQVRVDETAAYRVASRCITVARAPRRWLHPTLQQPDRGGIESRRDALVAVTVLMLGAWILIVLALGVGGYLDAKTVVLALFLAPTAVVLVLPAMSVARSEPAPRWNRRAGRSVTLTPDRITVRSEAETVDILPAEIGVVRIDPDAGRFAVVVVRANVSRCVMDALAREEARELARLVGTTLGRPVSLAARDVATAHR